MVNNSKTTKQHLIIKLKLAGLEHTTDCVLPLFCCISNCSYMQYMYVYVGLIECVSITPCGPAIKLIGSVRELKYRVLCK